MVAAARRTSIRWLCAKLVKGTARTRSRRIRAASPSRVGTWRSTRIFRSGKLTGGPDHTATSLSLRDDNDADDDRFLPRRKTGRLYFGVLAIDAAATITWVKNAAYTQGETPTALRNDEYLIQSVAASLAASWTVSVTTRGTWYIYVFLPAAGGGATAWGPQLSDQLNRIVQGS